MSKINPIGTDVARARDLLIQFTELVGRPGVRNDPVIKALLRGILPSNSPYETASMAVATLRNAGCFDSDMKKPLPPSDVAMGNKAKKEPVLKDKSSKGKEAQKLRGFDRTIDVLLEDAVYRKEYPDKESHPAAIALRKLRKDPDTVIEVQRIQAQYEEYDLPKGKVGSRFLATVKDEHGNPVLGDLETRRVKDVGDFDLLAIKAPKVARALMEEHNNRLFAWAIQPAPKLPDNYEDIWPSLKATNTLEAMKLGRAKITLIAAFEMEKFHRLGPSPTIHVPEFMELPSSA